MLRYLTAGESHGRSLTAILEGMPAGLFITHDFINREMARRQSGYGRGGRMKIEKDTAELVSGVRSGYTIGSPVAISIKNRDWENWVDVMNVEVANRPELCGQVTRPRPGHADLAGAMKYNQRDMRNILERSSARETAARVAVGSVCKRLLEEFGMSVLSWVDEIGGVCSSYKENSFKDPDSIINIFSEAESSDVRCPDKGASARMKDRIDKARREGDSLGGSFRIVALGVPPGIGSHVHYDRKIDAGLASALMSIQAIKGVEVGLGFGVASMPGSAVHDEIFYRPRKDSDGNAFWCGEAGFFRKSNNAGGIEGGMSNGEPILLRAAMKPIPTLYKPLKSVDIETRMTFEASVERSDICAVPAAAVVGEAVVAFEIARAFIDKFGGDSVAEISRNYKGYLAYLREDF